MAAHPIRFPQDLARSMLGLVGRGFLTPTFFSAVVMVPVLPLQLETLLRKVDLSLGSYNLEQRLFLRYAKEWPNKSSNELRAGFVALYQSLSKTHRFTITTDPENGIERLELIAIHPSNKYVIYYPGNAEDAMHLSCIDHLVKNKKYKTHNFIFWNYPGVEGSKGISMSIYDLIHAGIQQIQYLLNKGILARDITLYARSLGGGIAAQSADSLPYNSDHPNLEIDRSFMSISAVPLAVLNELLESDPRLRPLYSAVLAGAILGLSLGFVVAGLIATLGLVVATLIAALGYFLAHITQLLQLVLECVFSSDSAALMFLEDLTVAIDIKFSKFAHLVSHHIFNLLGSILGLVVAVIGLIIGSLCGVGVGAVLSLQTLISDLPPLYFSLRYAMKWLTFTAHVEIDSVAAIHSIIRKTRGMPHINSTNVEDDKVIRKQAALNTGLGFGFQPHEADRYPAVLSYFWYQSGGHNAEVGTLLREHPSSCRI